MLLGVASWQPTQARTSLLVLVTEKAIPSSHLRAGTTTICTKKDAARALSTFRILSPEHHGVSRLTTAPRGRRSPLPKQHVGVHRRYDVRPEVDVRRAHPVPTELQVVIEYDVS